jgi:hypothetical protein
LRSKVVSKSRSLFMLFTPFREIVRW